MGGPHPPPVIDAVQRHLGEQNRVSPCGGGPASVGPLVVTVASECTDGTARYCGTSRTVRCGAALHTNERATAAVLALEPALRHSINRTKRTHRREPVGVRRRQQVRRLPLAPPPLGIAIPLIYQSVVAHAARVRVRVRARVCARVCARAHATQRRCVTRCVRPGLSRMCRRVYDACCRHVQRRDQYTEASLEVV